MKKLQLLLLICALPIFVQAQSTLIVTNGSGDARIKSRQIVDVLADPNPSGMVFDRWTGDTALLQNPKEYHTKINPLSKNINITATYKSAPVWTPVYETINNTQVGYYFPAAPVGVIFHFHGASGDATQLFTPTKECRLRQ